MAVATSRDDEIRLIWTENQWLYLVAGFLGGTLFCLLLQLSINNLPELIINLLPEAAGIFITVTALDVLNRRRDKHNTIKHLKEQLIREAGSPSNELAKHAMYQLRKLGWLSNYTKLLVGANLMGANLQDAQLYDLNLHKVELGGANLQGASFSETYLKEAQLRKANLQGAQLDLAILEKAMLWKADLRGANLWGAYLKGASLSGAKLQGANLLDADLVDAYLGGNYDPAQFDETTILPDGTHWTPETDMTKFTKPKSDPDTP